MCMRSCQDTNDNQGWHLVQETAAREVTLCMWYPRKSLHYRWQHITT